ncbi:MAG: type II toxin-antitoxin system HicA family toxin [Candidatus Tectomicrobia bacterium]|nr:type II toxin-antitoxin system HicA family toxin [Candidatus Tectomicrobia bacterium]
MTDYARLRTLTARQLIGALTQDGFRFVRQRGSHHRYRHPDGRRVTVPFTRRGETRVASLPRYRSHRPLHAQGRNFRPENTPPHHRKPGTLDGRRPRAPWPCSIAKQVRKAVKRAKHGRDAEHIT